MSLLKERIYNFYDRLFDHYGPQNWWPGENEFECMVGAILTQNTSWKNVETAIRNIKSAVDLTVGNIYDMPVEDLSELIRPAGYYNQKAARLKGFANFLINRFDGRIEDMAAVSTSELRELLLSVKGIGQETADSILLYAFERPVFVIDKYTFRLLYRHGIVEGATDYENLQRIFTDNLGQNTAMFNEYHALIVMLGKKHCGKKANCDGCPLACDPHPLSNENI